MVSGEKPLLGLIWASLKHRLGSFPMPVISEYGSGPLLPSGKELAVLHVISELEEELGFPPRLGDVAEKYGVTRQAIHYWVKRLRLKSLVEEGPGAGHTLGSATPPIRLTKQGRYFIATSR